jgi:hypothetical protein
VKCPHCRTTINVDKGQTKLGNDSDNWDWQLRYYWCPECGRIVVELLYWEVIRTEGSATRADRPTVRLVYPKGASREPIPREVPEDFANDYREACLVFPDSPKASAALSRRCLQHILREKAGATERDLAQQIQTVLDSGVLPPYLADDLDAVRHIGNFATHPIKSQHTGEILPVDPGEAEWNLDVIESLFDFYFVAPARAQARRDALNQKLKGANKPPMKSSTR